MSTESDVLPDASLISASSTSRTSTLTEVVVPLTVKSPPTIILPAVSVLPFEASTVKILAPPTSKLPSTLRALLTEVVPVAAPISIAVAAPPMLSVVAVALTKLNVVAVVVISPPLTARSPVRTVSPPTFKFSTIPTPPATVTAPVVELVEVVVLSTARVSSSSVIASLFVEAPVAT